MMNDKSSYLISDAATYHASYATSVQTTGSLADVCSHEPQLTSSGYLEAMINYVKLCLTEPTRGIMLEVLESELSRLHSHNLLALHELILLITVYTGMILFGSCGSLLVIYIVIRQPRMRTPRNLFIVNLATSDLILCLFTQPFNLLRTLYWHYDWTLGRIMCKAVAMAQAANIFVSTISIIAIALDRLQVIVYPTRIRVHTAGAMAIIGSSWLFAILMASPMIAFSSVSHGTIRSDGSVCSANTIQSQWLRRSKFIYGIVTLIFQYCLPITIVSYAYTRICLRIRKRQLNRRTLRLNEMLSELASGAMTNQPHKPGAVRQNDHLLDVNVDIHKNDCPGETAKPGSCSELRVIVNETHLNADGERHKVNNYSMYTSTITNASTVQDREKTIQRRHTRTNALLAAVTITFILAWLPLHIFNLAMDLKESRSASDINQLDGTDSDNVWVMHDRNQTHHHIIYPSTESPSIGFTSDQNKMYFTGRISTLTQSFCLFCVLLSACINPVLYGWLNENFHKEFTQMCSACRVKLSCLRANARTRSTTSARIPKIHQNPM
ncbi:unnamed protein product [Echinostoma caproni]|uniref:G_PROTEIN_RECEP_F1_2 domain-containing protein n=1 Tax=Echinostoma caproni TaxID=27848 RepID=A0A183A6C7_9TREM|nr:unnamed protein product [Echinostoma caproni]